MALHTKQLRLGLVVFTTLAMAAFIAPGTAAQEDPIATASEIAATITPSPATATSPPANETPSTEEPGQTPTPTPAPEPTLVRPLPPIIVLPTCVDGVFTLGSISFQPTEGVMYPSEPIPLEPEKTYLIEARLEPGYAWHLPLTDGWTLAADGYAEFSITQDLPECTAVSLPVPVVVQPRCENGTLIPGSVTIPPTKGFIVPDIDRLPPLLPNITVRIEGKVERFYDVALPLTDGWVVDANNQLEFTIVTDSVECETPGPAEPPTEAPAPESPTLPTATTIPATDTTITVLPETGTSPIPGKGAASFAQLLGWLALGAIAFGLRHRRC